MIAKTFLTTLSCSISIGEQGSSSEKPSYLFGGVNVILCGDLHQFPPVTKESQDSLYWPTNLADNSMECQIGCTIYKEVQTVVILKEQMCVMDPIWQDLLVHLHHRQVQEQHIQILHSLVLHRSQTKEPVNFKSNPWANVPLITLQHAVYKTWNESTVRKACRDSGNQLFIFTTEDTIGGWELNMPERYTVAMQSETQGRWK